MVPKTSNTKTTKQQNFIAQLTQLLELDRNLNESDVITNIEDPINILATRIHVVNAINQSYFKCLSQFDIEKSKTYTKVI